MNKSIYFLLFTLVLLSCETKPQYNDIIPEHDSFLVDSRYVGEERVINVWKPADYSQNTERFPVLYMPDGGIKEDFPHIANSIAKLIENKSIPPIILVGIENTERGRDLTGFSEVEADTNYCPITDGAKNFRAFILEELVPEINSKYRTTSV
jgi:predicted alpha/beta superfamily hydrolase